MEKGVIKDQTITSLAVDTPLNNFIFQRCNFESTQFDVAVKNVDFKE